MARSPRINKYAAVMAPWYNLALPSTSIVIIWEE